LAATNLDLEREVAAKRFREDLFFRINVVLVALPPLRDRGQDILHLASHMLRTYQPTERRLLGFAPDAVEALLSYSWPGNVRELQNCIQRAIALSEFDHVVREDLPETMRQPRRRPQFDIYPTSELITVRELERLYIEHVLRVTGGNKTQAARILGFDRRTLYRKLASLAAVGDARKLDGDIPSAA
jgi:two-component system response regulator HydG